MKSILNRMLPLLAFVLLLASTFAAANGQSQDAAPNSTALVDAAEQKKSLTKLLSKENVDQVQPDGMTALHWATFHQNEDLVSELINAGASVDVKTAYGISPLAISCQAENASIVKRIIDAGADANQKRRGGETPLMTAARAGHAEIVKILLNAGAKVDAREHRKQTALMWAAAAGHIEVVSALLKAGANPKMKVWSGFTPIMFAARNGHGDVVRRLVDAGVDVSAIMDTKKKGGRSPRLGTSALMLAVENGHFELALEMVAMGADPNDQRSGFAPLHAVTWVRKTQVGDNPAGDPPPRESGNVTSLEFVRRMIEAGAKVDLQLERGRDGRFNPKGASPFMMAARTADIPLMKLLLELGANPKLKTSDETTAVMVAAGVGVVAVGEEPGSEPEVMTAIRMLVKLGVDIDAKNKNGETAMHGAAYRNYPKAVQLLDELGADPEVWNQKNRWKATPIEVASGKRPGSLKPSPETIAALKSALTVE